MSTGSESKIRSAGMANTPLSMSFTEQESSPNSSPTNQRLRIDSKSSADTNTELENDHLNGSGDEDGDDDDDDDDYGEDDQAVECTGHDHLETAVIDELVPFPVDTLYAMIFTDNDFYRHFQHVNKTTDVVINEWSEPDADGDRSRILTYTVAINHNMGPKSAATTEKQFVRHHTRPGFCYVIDAEAYTTGVPYGDSFYLLNRCCMTKTSHNTTRLRITSTIVYLKKVWGLIKSFIEKNVRIGTIQSYKLLGRLLSEEAEKVQVDSNQDVKHHKKILMHTKGERKPLQRSKRLNENQTEQHKINSALKHTTKQRCSRGKSKALATEDMTNAYLQVHIDTLAKFVFFLFLLLVVINLALFYKLNAVQEQADILTKTRKNLSTTSSIDIEGEWQPLFNSQWKHHKADIDKWSDILAVSVKIMDTMHKTLVELQTHITHHQNVMRERYIVQDDVES